MKICYFVENFVNMTEIDSMKINYCDENSWPQVYHLGYLGSIYECDQLYFTIFGCIWPF